MDTCIIASSLLAFLLYINTIPADFAYDDSRAILKNPDLLWETPVTQIFYDDFWGTPLAHSGSHKSYRPLTVLTFRLNYMLGGHSPSGYHVLNVVLHVAATALFTHTARVFLHESLPVVVAGLLFASHPVHTEAVAGVVGRADVLAAIFFLLALLSYIQYSKYRDKCTNSNTQTTKIRNESLRGTQESESHIDDSAIWLYKYVYLALTGLCAVLAMLCKEQGVTVLAVCLIYDLFLHSRLPVSFAGLRSFFNDAHGTREGAISLLLMACLFISCRVYLMGSKAPEFAPADNPASDCADLLTRTLTFCYLPVLNLWILLFPRILSFDWSMEAVPLVESVNDVRVVYSVAFCAALAFVLFYLVNNLNSTKGCSTKQTSSPVQRSPRSVYSYAQSSHSSSSSAGNINHNNSNHRYYSDPSDSYDGKGGLTYNGCTSHLLRHDVMTSRKRTMSRRGSNSSDNSVDSVSLKSEPAPSCYSSWQVLVISLAILVVPFIPATNLFFYVGFVIAERILYIPSMGFILIIAYGLHVLVQTNTSIRYTAIVALVTLLFAYSVRTLLRNEDWRNEENLYRSGIPVNPAKAWGNLANILNAHGKKVEAEEAYRNALYHRSNMADVHYNLGILLQDQQRYQEAIDSYQMAIQCRPRLTMAHLNLGIVLSTLGRKDEAEKIYRHCAEIDTNGLKDPRLHESTKISALYNLGRLLADQERYEEAVKVYKSAINRRPSHYAPQSLYNMLGEALFKLNQLHEAETWYWQALKAKPDHIPAHLTMAKLHHKKGNLEEAESWFLKAMQLDPKDGSVYQHYGQFLGEVGRHTEAAENYGIASQIIPTDFELVFNTANAMRQAGRNLEAEEYYKKAMRLRPNEATAHMNLGAILHFNNKWYDAERSYLKALKLKPNDPVTEANLQKLRNLINGVQET